MTTHHTKTKYRHLPTIKRIFFIWYVSFSCATMISNLDEMNSTNRSLTSSVLNPGSHKNRFSKDTRFLLTWGTFRQWINRFKDDFKYNPKDTSFPLTWWTFRKWLNHFKDNFKYNQLGSILQLVVAGSLRGSSDFSKTSGNVERRYLYSTDYQAQAQLLSSFGVSFAPSLCPSLSLRAGSAEPCQSPTSRQLASFPPALPAPCKHLIAAIAAGQPHAAGSFCTDSIFCSNRHSQLLPGNRTWISLLFWLKLCDLSQASIWPIGLSLKSQGRSGKQRVGVRRQVPGVRVLPYLWMKGAWGRSTERQYWFKCASRRFLSNMCRFYRQQWAGLEKGNLNSD